MAWNIINYQYVGDVSYRGSQQSSREVKPNLLIRHKGRQRTLGSLNSGVVNSAAPGNRLARKSLSVVTVYSSSSSEITAAE